MGLSFLSLPLFLFTLVVSMSVKHKSTPARNPLCSGASSPSDPSPASVQFRDDNAFKAFSKNFSRRGIHSERQVVLSDFADTDLPSVILRQSSFYPQQSKLTQLSSPLSALLL